MRTEGGRLDHGISKSSNAPRSESKAGGSKPNWRVPTAVVLPANISLGHVNGLPGFAGIAPRQNLGILENICFPAANPAASADVISFPFRLDPSGHGAQNKPMNGCGHLLGRRAVVDLVAATIPKEPQTSTGFNRIGYTPLDEK